MNKMLLGVLALSSVTGLATSLHGYVDSNTEVGAKKTVTYTEGKVNPLSDPTEANLKTRLDLGVFLNERKDMFAFAGTELGRVKGTDHTNPRNFYIGGRVDTEIGHGFNLVVNAAHKADFNLDENNEAVKEKNYFKNALVKHLEAKSKWNKDASDDDKKATLKSAGYLDEEKYSTLLSAVVDGKIDKTSLELGSIYRTANFALGTNNLTSFINVKHDFSKVKSEVGLEHVLDSGKATEYNNYGTLTGYVNLSSDKLVKDTTLSSKNSFNLKSGAGDVAETNQTTRKYELETKNEVVYKGIKDLEVVAKANYKFDDNKVDKLAIHTPEFGLKLVHTGVKGLTLTTDNTNKTKVVRNYNAEPTVTETSENDFATKNSAVYTINEMLTARAKVDYLLKSTKLHTENKEHTHGVVVGLGLTAKTKFEGMDLESNVDAGYRLKNYVKEQKAHMHNLYLGSTNKLTANLNANLKLEANLNVHNEAIFNHDSFYKNNFSLNPGAKLTLTKDKLEASSDLQLYYLNENPTGENNSTNELALISDNNLTYTISTDVKLMAGLKADYRYNRYSMEKNKIFTKYVGSYGYENYTDHEKSMEKINEELKGLKGEHDLTLTPKVSAELKYVDGRLTVKPALEAGFKFFDGEADGDTAKKRKC